MPPYGRWQRGARAIGGFASGTSRLARPPRQLLRPAVRPGGCVPPSPLSIHDTFDRPSYPQAGLATAFSGHTTTSGHTWVAVQGVHSVGQATDPNGDLNSVVHCTSNFGPAFASTGPGVTWIDYGDTTDLHLAFRTRGSDAGIIFCSNGVAPGNISLASSASYYLLLSPSGSISKTAAGGTLSTVFAGSAGAVDGSVFEVIKTGDTIESWRDGVLLGSYTDAGPLADQWCGLWHRFRDDATDPQSVYDWGYPYNPCDPDAFP